MSGIVVASLEDLRAIVREEMTAALARRSPSTPSTPLLMRPSEYGKRVGLCVKSLEGHLPREAWSGAGRMRRVRVADADAALLARPANEDDEISRLAKERAAR